MIEVLDNAHSLLIFYIIRHIAIVLIFLIAIDFFWKKQDFKFSYAVIRYIVLANWVLNLMLTLFRIDEFTSFINRATGPYWWAYLIMLICSFALPILLFHKKIGRNKWPLLVITFLSTFALTFELFVILLTALHHGFSAGSTIPSYINYLFLRPLIMTSFLVGIDVLFLRNKSEVKAAQAMTEEVLDGE